MFSNSTIITNLNTYNSNDATELFSAIALDDFAKVKKLITNKPQLLLSKNTDASTVFHYALKFSNRDIVELLLLQLLKNYPNDYTKIVCQRNIFNYTALHVAAERSSYDCFMALVLMALGPEIHNQAKFITNAGLLPLELTFYNYTNDVDKIRAELENYTIDMNPKPLNKLVDSNEVESTLTIDEINNPTLQFNLLNGIDAANFARSIIQASSTSPTSNLLDKRPLLRVKTLCMEVRNDYEFENFHLNPMNDPDHSLKLKNICFATINKRAGNCSEYSNLVMKALSEANYPYLAEMYSITNGDHSFVVIGRDRGSDPNDYRTWGKNAVVIDAWAGEVYPAHEIPNKLRDYYSYRWKGKRGCITYPFDSNFHQLAPDQNNFILNMTPAVRVTKIQQPSLSSFGLFPPATPNAVPAKPRTHTRSHSF